MLKEYFDGLTEGLAKKIAERKTGRRLLAYETGRLGQRMFNPRYSVAWTNVFVPFELLLSMDVAGFFIEFVGGMVASTGVAPGFLQRAEQAGYSTDGCSYHRCTLGAAMENLIPAPDLLIGATIPCDGGLQTVNELGRLYGKKVFVLNIPHNFSGESVRYLTHQFEEMIEYITEMTGKVMDYDRLRHIVHLSNDARGHLVDIFGIAKNIPSPVTGRDLKNFAIIFALLLGTEEGVEVARLFYDELKSRLETGAGGMSKEKYRLLWIQNRIQFKTRLIEHLEENYGANVVVDELNHIHWEDMDEDRPLESLAERMMTHPFNGPIQRRLDTMKHLAVEYKVVGAINPSHWGCRQSCGARTLFRNALQEVGVPVMNLDVDCVDERNYSEGQVLTRLEGFMEMIEK
ncbi:MAG: 2-hydroxyacyl-CoA dehydratase family protein [bacterium]